MDHDTALDEQSKDEDRLKEVHDRAMARFDDCAHDSQEMRANSLAARRFVTIPGAQWDGQWGEQFANAIKIESDKLRGAVRKVEIDYRENRIVPDFRPDGPTADKETADTLDGMHRADNYRFKSQQARDNGVFEALAGGFGAYRITNEWEDEGDPHNDHQRINPASIIVDADQSVFFDTNSRLYDKSDARFVFVRIAYSRDAFKEMFDERLTSFPGVVKWRVQDWFTSEQIAVAEYYEVEEANDPLYVFTHNTSGEEKRIWKSELDDGEAEQLAVDGWAVEKQNRKRKRVRKYIMSGAEVIEDRGYIAGDKLPIIPVYGKRYYVEGMERWEGIVQPKMDDQRLHNTMLSHLAELATQSPREVPIFDPEQMTGNLPNHWAEANIKRLPYLLAASLRDDNGGIVQAGPVGYLKPPDVPPVTANLIQYTGQSLAEESVDGADEVKANTSAEAMDIAATRVDAKSGIYLDNIRQSVQREGEVYISMARQIYSEPKRKVETMTEDGDDGEAVLMQRVADDDGAHRIINDLKHGKYKVIVSVNEATATRRDKTVRSMMHIAEVAGTLGDQETAQAALLTAVLNTEGEGSDDFNKWARKRALNLGLVEPNEDELKAMAEAQENEEPDPTQELITAQSEALRAEAQEKVANISDKMASAEKKAAETREIEVDTAIKLRGGQA